VNAEEAIMLIRVVKAAFPAQRIDEYTIDVWAEALRGVDFGEARSAVLRLVGKQTFASVAEIIAETKTHRRDALLRLKDRDTFRAIEAAKDYDPDVAQAARDEAREAFRKAIDDARRKRDDDIEEAS
jgi:hypothetical protein